METASAMNICRRVVPGETTPGVDVDGNFSPSSIEHCHLCQSEIWVAAKTMARAAAEMPGAAILCFCHECFTSVIIPAGTVGEYRLTPAQEWMRPFLPKVNSGEN